MRKKLDFVFDNTTHHIFFGSEGVVEVKKNQSTPKKMVCRSEGEDYLYSNVAYASSDDTDDMPLLEPADAENNENNHHVVNPAEEEDHINNDQRTQHEEDEYYRELLQALSDYYTRENTTLRQSVLFPSTQDLSPPPLRRQINNNQLLSEVLYENMRSMFQYMIHE